MTPNFRNLLTLSQRFIDDLLEGKISTVHRTLPPEQTGLSRTQSSSSPAEIEKARHTLIEHTSTEKDDDGNEVTTVYEDAASLMTWLSEGYSISAMIKLQATHDPQFEVAPDDRIALRVLAQVIMQSGQIYGSEGHSALPYPLLVNAIVNPTHLDLEGDERAIKDAAEAEQCLAELMTADFLRQFDGNVEYTSLTDRTPNRCLLYYPPYAKAEYTFVKALQKVSPGPLPGNPDCEGLSVDQALAVKSLWDSPTVGFILTGGGGTGKTFISQRTVKALGPEKHLALATTGAAKSVLERALGGVRTMTISRAACVRRGPDASAVQDSSRRILIVDECSMLNMQFLMQLQTVIDRPAGWDRIVIAGDANQLPPVGVGAIYESVSKRGLGGITSATLTTQHRMPPKGVKYLQLLSDSVTSARRAGLEEYGVGSEIPRRACEEADSAFEVLDGEVHSVTMSEPCNILRRMLKLAPLLCEKGYDTMSRDVISAHRNSTARHLSSLIEYARHAGESDINNLVTAAKNLQSAILRSQVVPKESGKWKIAKECILTPSKGTWKNRTYANHFPDELAAYKDIIGEIDQEPTLREGALVRCTRNVWTKSWSESRIANLAEKMGIHGDIHGELTNGLLMCVEGRKLVAADDPNVWCTIADESKAQHAFPLAWVSTTHKLQGDAGRNSFHIFEPSSNTALAYVALSRGRVHNQLIIPRCSMAWAYEKGKLPIRKNVSRLSILEQAIEVRRGKNNPD